MVDVVVCGQLLAAVSHEVLLRHDFGVRYLEGLDHGHFIFGVSGSSKSFGIQLIGDEFALGFGFPALAS